VITLPIGFNFALVVLRLIGAEIGRDFLLTPTALLLGTKAPVDFLLYFLLHRYSGQVKDKRK
jgi:hypothetical protein